MRQFRLNLNILQKSFIIIFDKNEMAQRELTLEEANRLCQSALILICRQNLQEKLKTNKVNLSPTSKRNKNPTDSPRKIQIKQPKQLISQSSTIDIEPNPDRSPLKKDPQSCGRLTAEKEPSLNNLLEVSEGQSMNMIQKQCLSFSLGEHRSAPALQEENNGGKEGVQKRKNDSQMVEETQPKLFSQAMIKELKRDLEINSRGKICRTQETNPETEQIEGYHLFCKNDQECPFHYYLAYTGTRTRKGEKMYKLVSECTQHLPTCLEGDEELAYMKLTKLIDSMEDRIRELLSQNGQLKPKDILTTIAREMGENDHKFIYKGLKNKIYHKAAKKYFDNLIYKVKNPLWAS